MVMSLLVLRVLYVVFKSPIESLKSLERDSERKDAPELVTARSHA
jgi:hypothetical protein